MSHPVEFIAIESDEKDLILSFAIKDDEIGVKSLILHRTLLFEEFRPDDERGVNVSLEGDYFSEEPLNMLESIEISKNEIKIKAKYRSYIVDVSKIDKADISELKLLVTKQNYDNRFKITNA